MESNEADHRRAAAIQLYIERKLIAVYGFCANPSLTAFQNAVKIRGETNACLYFSKPANLAFYNLTPDKRVPNIAKSVLGLNLKFIYLQPLAIIYIYSLKHSLEQKVLQLMTSMLKWNTDQSYI